MKYSKVLVHIPTKNRDTKLGECLGAVCGQSQLALVEGQLMDLPVPPERGEPHEKVWHPLGRISSQPEHAAVRHPVVQLLVDHIEPRDVELDPAQADPGLEGLRLDAEEHRRRLVQADAQPGQPQRPAPHAVAAHEPPPAGAGPPDRFQAVLPWVEEACAPLPGDRVVLPSVRDQV